MNIDLIERGIDELQLIKPLWEQLNTVHYEKTVYFKDKYRNFTFEKRMESIYDKAKHGRMKLDLLLNRDTGTYIGYCLSSIENNSAEIESIFIESMYRKFGLGGRLIENALKWFDVNGITNIQIGVVYDNDDALPFYQRYGFYISSYVLRKK